MKFRKLVRLDLASSVSGMWVQRREGSSLMEREQQAQQHSGNQPANENRALPRLSQNNLSAAGLFGGIWIWALRIPGHRNCSFRNKTSVLNQMFQAT
jgi:hypothetical protein